MSTHHPIPQLLLEKIASGVYSQEQISQIRHEHHISAEDLQAALEALQEDNHAILNAYPREEFTKAVFNLAQQPTQTTTKPTYRRHFALSAAAIAAAAIAIFTFGPLTTSTSPHNAPQPITQEPDTIRLKGAQQDTLRLWKAQEPTATLLKQGETVQEGDTLQIEYALPKQTHGLILSIDGEHTITLHAPENTRDSAILKEGKQRLPYSYTLDNAPYYEQFVLLSCTQPVDTTEMLERIEEFLHTTSPSSSQTKPPRLPQLRQDCSTSTYTLLKPRKDRP